MVLRLVSPPISDIEYSSEYSEEPDPGPHKDAPTVAYNIAIITMVTLYSR